MDTTTNLNLPIPNADAVPPTNISGEFPRIALALTMLDEIIHTLQGVVAGKAATDHTQAISTITGLVEALAAKMPANATFSLDDLQDVQGAAAAAVNYVLVKNAEGKWVPSSALAAIGEHDHSIAQVVGLGDILEDIAEVLAGKAPQTTTYTKTEVNTLLDAKGVPLGTLVYSALDLTAQGYLLRDGSPITNLYPDLRAAFLAAGAPFGMSGADPLLPNDMNPSRFIRSANAEIPLGTVQDDAVGPLEVRRHDYVGSTSSGSFGMKKADIVSGLTGFTGNPAFQDYARSAAGDTFDVVRGVKNATETRPKSIAYLPYIKAFGAITIEGMADLSQLLNAIASEAAARLGANNTDLMTPLRTKQHVDARFWESGQQTITSAGTLTLAHPLGAVPKALTGRLVNISAEYGFSPGQTIDIPLGTQGATGGVTAWADASNIYIQYGGATGLFAINRRNAPIGTVVSPTNALWRFVIGAQG